jgi:glycosyltransferase involved in cell wall biosynthesis
LEPATRNPQPATLRILYLSQYFPPEVGATQTRAHEMARYLAARGHQVTMLTEVPNHPSGIIPPEYRGKLWERAPLDGIDVVRLWVWAAPEKGFLTRMRFYLSYMCMAILAGLVLGLRPGRRYDVVYATSPPLFVGLAGAAIALLIRARFVFEVRDLWPESAVALGELNNPRAVRLAASMARVCYRRARRVVAVTQGIVEGLRAAGVPRGKISLIPNGANVEQFHPAPAAAAALRARLGLDGKFVVLYAGIHGLAQGMESLVETARRLRDHADIVFVFVGAGPKKAAVERLKAEHGLDNLLLLPEQPRAAMPAYLSLAGAALVPLRAAPLFEGALPSKMFEAMACGAPVLLSARGEAAAVLAAAGAGRAVPPEDPAALAAAILDLKAQPAEAAAMGQRGRAFVARQYSRREQARRLERLLRAVVRRGRARPEPKIGKVIS